MDRKEYVESIIRMLSVCSNKKIRIIYQFVLHLCR